MVATSWRVELSETNDKGDGERRFKGMDGVVRRSRVSVHGIEVCSSAGLIVAGRGSEDSES